MWFEHSEHRGEVDKGLSKDLPGAGKSRSYHWYIGKPRDRVSAQIVVFNFISCV